MSTNGRLGVWLKRPDEIDDLLVYVDEHPMKCSRFIEVNYPDKKPEDFVITTLPRWTVEIGTGPKAEIIGAFDTEEKAILFGRDYLVENDLDPADVHVVG